MKKIAIMEQRHTARNENYYLAVEACGASAVRLYKDDELSVLNGADGLILPGGADVDPALYNEKNNGSIDIDTGLDSIELRAIKRALELRLPILGICRGHQILNVYFGGSLIQDVKHGEIHKNIGNTDRVHLTEVLKDTFLYEIYRSDRISVNSAHHQAVKELGKNLMACQYSEDGLIEAFCHTELPVYGVQWHPERMCLKNAREDTVSGFELFEFFVKRL